MTTAARTNPARNGHWYTVTGEPCYTVIGKTTGQPRPTTLADARKLNLMPSVTTILSILNKPALESWKIEQAVLACLTSKQNEGEPLDAFVNRILNIEQVQNQERDIARDRGTDIHNALELWFTGQKGSITAEILPWIQPAAEAIEKRGVLVAAEKCLCGLGYAGKTDLILDHPECWWLLDWKGTKKLPDPKKGGAWDEHVLQAAAYAMAYGLSITPQEKQIRTGNIYISTVNCGEFSICDHNDWVPVYQQGFKPLVEYWQWKNNYRPEQKLAA